MKTLLRLVVITVLFAACIGSEALSAGFSGPANDGWHTWRVEATSKAPESCCFTWNSGTIIRKGCDLDSKHGNYGSIRDDATAVGELQIYALMQSGKLSQLRALSSGCVVTASSEISDLGVIDTDDSIDWLQRHIEPESDTSSDAIMAISLHLGTRPVAVLASIVNNATDREIREHALFWLAQSDSDAAFEFLGKLF